MLLDMLIKKGVYSSIMRIGRIGKMTRNLMSLSLLESVKHQV